MYYNTASVLYFGVLGGAYGTLLSLPRIKPAPPELEGESLGTGPPGKSWNAPFLDKEAQQTDHWIKEALSQLVGGGWGNLSHSTFSDGPWKWDASVDTIKSFLGQTFRPRVKTMEEKMSSLQNKPNNTIKKLAQWTRSGPSKPAIYTCKPEHPIRGLKKCSLVRLPAVNKIIPKENKWAHTGRVPTVAAGISPHGQEMLALSCRLCRTGDLLQLGSNVPPWNSPQESQKSSTFRVSRALGVRGRVFGVGEPLETADCSHSTGQTITRNEINVIIPEKWHQREKSGWRLRSPSLCITNILGTHVFIHEEYRLAKNIGHT